MLLSFAFAAAWTVTSAMAAHLPRIVEAFGATPAQAVFAGMMIGPAQVAARVLEASVLSRFHPLRLDAARLHHPSDRRLRHRPFRRRRRGGFRAAARRRQRHPDHRARNAAAGDLRAGELCLSARPDRRALADRPGAGAAHFGLLIEPMGRGIIVVSSALSLSALVALLLLRARAASLDAEAKAV